MAASPLLLTGQAPTRRVHLPSIDPVVIATLVPTTVIVGLLLVVFQVSLRENVTDETLTLRHYARLYTDPFVYETLLNTAGFALTTMAVAFLFGVPIAWLVERTDLPGKPIVFTVMTLGVLIPSFFTAIGWLFLLHPRVGLVNQVLRDLLGLRTGPLDIVSIPGMGWVQGMSLSSLVFVMTAASMRGIDAALEESAQMSGAGFLTTLRRITLPLATPSLLAAAVYVLTTGISAFDVPAIIGLTNRIFTFSTYLFVLTHPLQGLPEYGLPAAFSTVMVVLALGLSWVYGSVLVQAKKYQVVTGKNYRPKLVPLGRRAFLAWLFVGAFILLSQVVPLLLLVWASLLPYLQPPSAETLGALSLANFVAVPWPLVTRGVTNTLILAIGAPTLALVASMGFSWVILRTRHRFRLAFDFAAFLPHAIPHIVFGVGALLVSLFYVKWPVDLYGTLTLLLLMYCITHISFGTRVTNAALIQIHQDLEEAGYVSGASKWSVVRRIVLPLLAPAFMYAWLWLALLTVRELTLATMLFSPENITLSVVVWSIWSSGNASQASAVTLVMMALLLPLVVVYWRFGRQGAQR
jgi:iron(III) transport system permease protein